MNIAGNHLTPGSCDPSIQQEEDVETPSLEEGDDLRREGPSIIPCAIDIKETHPEVD